MGIIMNSIEQEQLWDEEDGAEESPFLFEGEKDKFKDGKIRTFHAGGTGGAEYKYKPPCYETHPALLIGGKKVYGGSCGSPMVTNADIYIGLDGIMMRENYDYPWNDPPKHEHIYFPIPDGSIPSRPAEFQKMITWLAVQLAANKLIHIGCIGGHGRTGMVLAALVKEVDGIEDAITYVREHYCHKAVESAVQVAFLHKYYGIKVVPPSRHPLPHSKVTSGGRAPASFMKDSKGAPFPSKPATNAAELNAQIKKQRMEKGPGEVVRRAPAPAVPAIPLALRSSLPQGPIYASPGASLMSVWGTGPQPLVDKRKKPAKMQVSQEGEPNGDHVQE